MHYIHAAALKRTDTIFHLPGANHAFVSKQLSKASSMLNLEYTY